MAVIGYVRVSSKEQNIDRQMDEMKSLGIEEKNIYIDKESGKDFERIGYQYMKRRISKGDLIYIKSIDRLGRNYNEIIKEFKELTGEEIEADIKVIDMPLLDTTMYKDLLGNFISDLVLQVLSFAAHKERETIKKNQKEGIESARARGVHLGRPKQSIDEESFKEEYRKWKAGEQSAAQSMRNLNLKANTFYRRVKEYEKSIQ